MNQKTFILIGRSGCGKGTQGKLLADHLKKIDPSREVLYVQSGTEFREFIKGESETQLRSRKIMEAGDLQPEFLAIYMWVNFLVKNYKGNQNVIIDGTPRKFHEAGVLHSIFDFYNLEKPTVVHIAVSKNWSVDHLLKRGRFDDTRESIEGRLAWFETDVVPTIEYYKKAPEYRFVEINGERSIEEVQKDLIVQLGL